MSKARPNGGVSPRLSLPLRLLPTAGFAAAAAFVPSACLERPICAEDCSPRTTNVFLDAESQRSIDKIDLLFMIDNSGSMADKQEVFAKAVPDLVRRFVNPVCVERGGTARFPGDTPPPGAACPAGYEREFRAVSDIHIGVITSSLGGYGTETCTNARDPLRAEEGNDRSHLVGSRPRFAGFLANAAGPVQMPRPEGFLDWNPGQLPGQDPEALITTFQAMTRAADESGCGYEASLESVYRFLSDPKPALDVRVEACGAGRCSVPVGVDEVLLAQRAAFLRPDSLVAVILLSDENDCSLQVSPYGFLAVGGNSIAEGTNACLTNPNDPCCYSCAVTSRPEGCPEAPECNPLPQVPASLRNIACHEQKRRFGHDFLYPTQRYVNALREPRFCASLPDLSADEARCPDADGDGLRDMVDNPLLVSKAGLRRDPSLVFLAGIIGVPWQDLRAKVGVEPSPSNVLSYKTATEMKDDGTWDVILGTREPGGGGAPIPPRDALMVESVWPRSGSAADGSIIAPPDAPRWANPVNGHEWESANDDDLQYACIFPLPAPEPCVAGTSAPNAPPPVHCDCDESAARERNPLCQAPDGTYGTTQHFAKAYPGLRQLQVLKDFGERSIVASICAKELADPTADDYGYRPAVEAIVGRLKTSLSLRCLPRRLERASNGKYPCSIVEATPAPGATCEASRGRSVPSSGVVRLAKQRMEQSQQCNVEGTPSCTAFTFCELAEAGPECRDGKATPESVGYCYVDPEQNPGDDPDLVAGCDPEERRILRFIDPEDRTPASGARILIACAGAPLAE